MDALDADDAADGFKLELLIAAMLATRVELEMTELDTTAEAVGAETSEPDV